MDRVTVYRFLIYDESTGAQALSLRLATERAIGQVMDATLVAASARVVGDCCIDQQGFLIEMGLPG